MCIPAAARGAPRGCDSGGVTEESVPVVETAWLTMPDLVEVLGEPLGRVRRLLDDRHLIGSKRTGVFAVPEVFVVDGAPLGSLRGTIVVLQDAGFSDDAVIDWLLADSAPTDLLREFVPDDDPELIAAEAAVLRGLFAR